jgi:hypothetical protein
MQLVDVFDFLFCELDGYGNVYFVNYQSVISTTNYFHEQSLLKVGLVAERSALPRVPVSATQ